MATQDYPIFEITATFPSVGQRTGRFEFKKATIEAGIETGYLVDDGFSDIAGILADLAGSEDGSRRGITVDTGGGRHVNEVDFTLRTGDDGQWGYSADTNTLDEATASGGDRLQKIQVFNRYLMFASPDSFTPATLELGEYAPGGVMPTSGLDVYLEGPSFTRPRDESTTASGNIRFISTIDLTNNAPTSQARTD